MKIEPRTPEPAPVAAAADAPVLRGLTSAEAANRLAADGLNELPTARKRSMFRQVWDVLHEPMLFLLLGAGVVNFLLSEPLDGLIMLAGALVVIAISIYEEHKTENALAALRDLSSPRALVIRDGSQLRIAGRDVVRGDIVLLAEGDRVPADAVLVECVNLTVDESAMTGESVPVRKAAVPSPASDLSMGPPGGDGTPWVFSGTLVVKGRAVAVVIETGFATQLGRIGAALESIETERTPLQHEVDRLVAAVGVAGAVAVVLVVTIYGLTRHDWLEGLLAGIATAMAMLPEEFPVVLTVFLALGAWRMSQRNVLARRTAMIEALGSATAICVDKTGTLTLNTMNVRELIVDGETYVLGEGALPERFHELAEFATLASPPDPFDPMDKAFTDLGEHYLAQTEHLHHGWRLVREYPLSENLLALSHVWLSPDLNDYVIAAKGAPEAIADLCHFDAGRLAELVGHVEAATASGLRVLAVARARFQRAEELPTGQHDFTFEYLGLAGLHDPVRPGVPEAVAECTNAGVRVLMITGDYPGTALAVARAVGIDTGGGVITGPELTTMEDTELAARIGTVNVFARMVPEQKLRLVGALKRTGNVVGMTGDGVNDAPALRAADIGIAMGARGTDVAREAAGLVITDDNFASIAGGIRRGRGIFDNLRKAMAYLIAVHVTIFGMALIPVFIPHAPLVLLPVQIAFLELIIDPACSVVFEAEEIDPRIMEQRPRRIGAPIFDRHSLVIAGMQGASVLVMVLAVYAWAISTGRPDDAVRSITFVALVVSNLALILVNRSWRLSIRQSLHERRNPTLKWIMMTAAVVLVALLCVPSLRGAFDFGALRPFEWPIAVLAGFFGVAWFEIYKIRRR